MYLKVIHGLAAGQEEFFRRSTFDRATLSEELSSGIQDLFGEPLSAEESTRRILADVRLRGDAAVR